MILQNTIGRSQLRPIAFAVATLSLATLAPQSEAADALVFNGADNYAQIQPWQPAGSYKVIAWLGDVNPDGGAKNIFLSNSSNGEYLAHYHNSTQAQFGSLHPGIWGQFSFERTKYIEIEIHNGKMIASDGEKTVEFASSQFAPNNTQFDWLFRRNGKNYQGSIEGLALIDLNDPSNSRAYAFDRTRGLVEVGGNASTDGLVNIDANDWADAKHNISNPAPTHFTQADWQAAFYPDATQPEPTPEPVEPTPEPVEPTPEPVEPTPEPVEPTPEPVEPTPEPVEPVPSASDAVVFDGADNYGEIAPWKPTGRYTVIAHMAELDSDAGARTVLLSSSTTSEFLGFTHNTVQGRWGNAYPGIWNQFNFNETKYIEMTIDNGTLTASDGVNTVTWNDPNVTTGSISYDWLFRRGWSDYSKGALQSLTLIDYGTPSNSRSYAFSQEHGMVEVNGNNDSTLHNLDNSDWTDGTQTVTNPDGDIFDDAQWDSVYGNDGQTPVAPTPEPVEPTPEPVEPTPEPVEPTPEPVEPTPEPTPEPDPDMLPLTGEHSQAVRFDGSNDYLDINDWQPKGDYRVVAWLEELNPDANAQTHLVSGTNGNYLAFTHTSVEGQWNGSAVRIDNKFAFSQTRYVEISVSNGVLTASDGQTTVSTNNGAVSSTSTRFDSVFRVGNQYSKGALQSLALIDFTDTNNARGYYFNDQQQVVETGASPSGNNYLQGTDNGSWIEIQQNVVTPKPLINSQAEWDAAFDKLHWGARPLIDVTNANDQNRLAWEGHYWLRAYLTMAETYNDDKYLDYAVELIDHMFKYTDEQRAQRGEINIAAQPYDSAPKHYLNNRGTAAAGWRMPYAGSWRIAALTDGQLLNPIARVVDYIKSENKTAYMAKADAYIQQSLYIINSHNSSFSYTKNGAIQGSYYYVHNYNNAYGDGGLFSNPVPYNHNMTMGIALIYINKWLPNTDAEMTNKVNSIIGFFQDHMLYNADGTCTWNYAFDVKGNTKLEDVNHAHLDVGFMVTATEEGYLTDENDVQCLTNTMTDKVFIAPGMISYNVDGGGISSQWDMIATGYDWELLRNYDERVLDMNKHVLRHYGKPNWYRAMTAWANVLAADNNK